MAAGRKRRGGRAEAARDRRHVPARRRRRGGLGPRRGARRRTASRGRCSRSKASPASTILARTARGASTSARCASCRSRERARSPARCGESAGRARPSSSSAASSGLMGSGFSPDESTIYACDLRAARYWPTTSRMEARRPGGACSRTPLGEADGLAVDTEGAVWVALGSGGSVGRFLPDGSLDREVDVPADFVSSVCFGGSDHRDLYITTVGALFRRGWTCRGCRSHSRPSSRGGRRRAEASGAARPADGIRRRGRASGRAPRRAWSEPRASRSGAGSSTARARLGTIGARPAEVTIIPV